jgi:hypothetical protein
MKWKVFVVAAIGAAALGFSDKAPSSAAPLALAVVPFVCAYIDLLCRNLSVRSKRASGFLASQSDAAEPSPVVRYEQWYQTHKEKTGRALESFALLGSTALLSVASAPVGIVAFANSTDVSWQLSRWPNCLFYGASMLGLGLLTWTEVLYRLRKEALHDRPSSPA